MYLLGRNRLRVDMIASIVGLVITLALDFALIPAYGFRGAAVASSIAYTVAMLVNLAWVIATRAITPTRPADRAAGRRAHDLGPCGRDARRNRSGAESGL